MEATINIIGRDRKGPTTTTSGHLEAIDKAISAGDSVWDTWETDCVIPGYNNKLLEHRYLCQFVGS